MHEAQAVWSSLPQSWQRAFEAAWASWRVGSGAVGAVVADAGGAIVSVGQNRILDPPGGPGLLAGTLMAHAEMNALAALPPGEYDGHTLYTTFEPCLMCAATIIGTYHIPRIAFAAYDPTWHGLLDGFREFPAIAPWLPERDHLGGPYGALAYVLHLTWCLRQWPGGYEAHQRLTPAQLALSQSLLERRTLRRLADDGATTADVAQALWTDLCHVADWTGP